MMAPMGASLPDIAPETFQARLTAHGSETLTTAAQNALYAHYQELRRWNPTLSLIGPGTAAEVVERHYGESLAALPLIPPAPAVLVDVGSGAGFPGFVLAATRPHLAVTLVEAQARKWAFLEAACRRAALPCRCLNARVAAPLPAEFPAVIDLVTARAIAPEALAPLVERLAPSGRILLWTTGTPELGGLAAGRAIALPGSERRRIVELRRGAA
jgi:16S rRNA (guanine527-N7)-methyltransferase